MKDNIWKIMRIRQGQTPPGRSWIFGRSPCERGVQCYILVLGGME